LEVGPVQIHVGQNIHVTNLTNASGKPKRHSKEVKQYYRNTNVESNTQQASTWHRWWWASNGWRVEVCTDEQMKH